MKIDVWMVSLSFCNLPNFIYEFESRFKVFEFELFENAANAMRVQLQAELGADFEIVYVPLGKS